MQVSLIESLVLLKTWTIRTSHSMLHTLPFTVFGRSEWRVWGKPGMEDHPDDKWVIYDTHRTVDLDVWFYDWITFKKGVEEPGEDSTIQADTQSTVFPIKGRPIIPAFYSLIQVIIPTELWTITLKRRGDNLSVSCWESVFDLQYCTPKHLKSVLYFSVHSKSLRLKSTMKFNL